VTEKQWARYAGLTGSPDESGAKRREQGLARAGKRPGVRRGMIQLAWRFSAVSEGEAHWPGGTRPVLPTAEAGTRKTMIVALARKLLIALWRFCHHRRDIGGASSLRPAG